MLDATTLAVVVVISRNEKKKMGYRAQGDRGKRGKRKSREEEEEAEAAGQIFFLSPNNVEAFLSHLGSYPLSTYMMRLGGR